MRKVALVHDWLTGMRGGERCLEVFCELFPNADIYTLLHVKGTVSSIIEKHPIKTSFIQHLPWSSSRYRYYLPLFPRAIESFDLKGYDLILSSSHCVAKGISVPPGTCHLSYIYTPMRYVWDQYDAYFSKGRASFMTRTAMRMVRPRLQQWDMSSNNQVNSFIAISRHVARRIKSYWNRESVVVYPPVHWQAFEVSHQNDGFYLMVTSLVAYKRVDLAVQAANRLGIGLKIIGSGPEMSRLRALAGSTVEFLGWQSDHGVVDYLIRCKALLFPGEEDFGIVPLEAMACGKPVIAYGKGGVLETVIPLNPQGVSEQGGEGRSMSSNSDNPTGVFFYEQTVEALVQAIQLFEQQYACFHPASIRNHVAVFDRVHFKQRIQKVVKQQFDAFCLSSPQC